MDQRELRRLENQCIQEDPPECTAACPLHIDVRAFVGYMAVGNWTDALKTLRRTMPLPNILGRICDAPCENRCKRAGAGGAIRIGLLERTCVRQNADSDKPFLLPARGGRVAVVGSGLSSLTAAWDCLRKGYGVLVMARERTVGEHLHNRYAGLLTRNIMEEETAFLTKLGLEIEPNVRTDEPRFLDRCLETFDAVYLGLDDLPCGSLQLGEGDRDKIRVEPRTQKTGRQGVFAGGLPRAGTVSPVWQAAEGRFAANSIDRYLQKVSLTAGREKEGPLSTRLFTGMADVVPLPAVEAVDPLHGYTGEEALREASRCLQCQCLECVKVCVYLERFGAYPKKYAREIYNNESIVMGPRQANKLINSCSLCGLCQMVCPEGFAMQDLCLQARRSMVTRGKMPPSAHEFALLDMVFSQGGQFALARHEPGLVESRQAFFPGCQLCGSAPDKIPLVYEHLRASLSGGVALMLGCCAAPAYWAGEQNVFTGALGKIREQWHNVGRPTVILACPTCLRIFKDYLGEIPVVSLWRILEETWSPVSLPSPATESLAIHDSCTTRFEPEVQSSVRTLLSRLGIPVEEVELGREKTECCGFGGLLQIANPALAREVAYRRAQKSKRDYLAYCAMCRDNFVSVGKRALHLLDLLFPDPQMPDPAGRERPGWSQRRENRSRLKENLLREIWLEESMQMEDYRKIKLRISSQVLSLLEERRILEDDLKRVIHHAEKSGEKFYNRVSGRFKACFKPYNITFWVEYSPSEGGFIVFNAYLHRMEAVVP